MFLLFTEAENPFLVQISMKSILLTRLHLRKNCLEYLNMLRCICTYFVFIKKSKVG